MTWCTDDRRHYWERRRLDEAQAEAKRRMGAAHPPFASVMESKMVTHKTFLLEGGPYHMHHPRVALDEDGKPPLWLHMVDPIGALHNLLMLAELQDANVHVYERRTRQDPATGLQVWYYRHWTPTDGPNLSE